MCLKNPVEKQPEYVFVYGSLRPDDDSAQIWTSQATKGMRQQRAFCPFAKLYEDKYAAAVVSTEGIDLKPVPAGQDQQMVHGWLMGVDDPNIWEEKLKFFDNIEGYCETSSNNLYERIIVQIVLKDDFNCTGQPIGKEGEVIQAFIYHRPSCVKNKPIESGDWLKRQQKEFKFEKFKPQTKMQIK